MELILEIVSYHRLSPEQISKKSITSTATLGRSENNDWHLPDPEKVVSGIHAKVERRLNDYYIYDLSTNGLYINRSVEALGKDNSHKLVEGDLLTFGDYEVSVTLVHDTVKLTQVNEQTYSEKIDSEHESPEIRGINSANLVANISPSQIVKKPVMPMVTNELNDHFELPQAIPEEWDVDLLKANSQSVSSRHSNGTSKDVEQCAVSESSTFKLTSDELPPKNTKKESTSFNAFFQGLGLSSDVLTESLSDEVMYDMGKGMQLMLLGLMETLRNRTKLKNEFRINQTTFQHKENNPLKFSASIDDVVQNLFLKKSSSFLSASKAITEAFNDTRKHEVALTAGALGAIEGILNQLDPIEIENRDFKESLFDQVLPRQKQLRYWKIYQILHKDMSNEITTQGSSALSDDFVKAYDKKIKSL